MMSETTDEKQRQWAEPNEKEVDVCGIYDDDNIYNAAKRRRLNRRRYEGVMDYDDDVELGRERGNALYCPHHECKSKLFHRYLKTGALIIITLIIVHLTIFTESGGKEIVELMKLMTYALSNHELLGRAMSVAAMAAANATQMTTEA